MTLEEAIIWLKDDIKEINRDLANEEISSTYAEEGIKVYEMAISAIKEVQQYREIGTVEECRVSADRREPKRIKNRKILKDFHGRPYCIQGDCPNCGCEAIKSTATDYCYVCGQHLKWGENLEVTEDE